MIDTYSDLKELESLYEEEREKTLLEIPPWEVADTEGAYYEWVDRTTMSRAKDRLKEMNNEG